MKARPPMNREVSSLLLAFSSAFVGATIMFLAALLTFTFHHEVHEYLLQRGLLVPDGPRPIHNPAAQRAMGRIQQNQNEENPERDNASERQVLLYVLAHAGHVPRLPVAQLPPTQQGDHNQHLQIEDVPAGMRASKTTN